MGSAVPDRPAPRPPGRRGLLEEIPHDAESVHPSRRRAAALALAIWRPHSIRVTPPADRSLAETRDRYAVRLRALLDPLAAGLSVQDVRTDGLAASRGSTDFGEYFTYFSFFLVLSALLLAGLFFRLGVEQRAREVGLLRAVGYTTGRIRGLLAGEGLVVTMAGGVIGIGGAIAYASMMMTGLGSWWSGAVGTDALRLHVSATSLAGGVIGVAVTAMACLWWTLRSLSRVSERSLLSGMLAADALTGRRRVDRAGRRAGAIGCAVLGLALIVASAAHVVDKTGAFFGASAFLLAASLCVAAVTLRRPAHRPIHRDRLVGDVPVGTSPRRRSARPKRAGHRRDRGGDVHPDLGGRVSTRGSARKRSALGRRRLFVAGRSAAAAGPRSQRAGRAAKRWGSPRLPSVRLEPFRVMPGDDASCLNLYEPKNPTILGASRAFIESGRFTFQSAVPGSDAERANPWLLLNRHDAGRSGSRRARHRGRELDDLRPAQESGRRYRDRSRRAARTAPSGRGPQRQYSAERAGDVGGQFSRAVSGSGGIRSGCSSRRQPSLVARLGPAIEEGASDLGAHVESTAERLAGFHRVENTYISTFQTLGGLGLLVGTIGLAAVLLRNVLERRRELALLGGDWLPPGACVRDCSGGERAVAHLGPRRRYRVRGRGRCPRRHRSRGLAADRTAADGCCSVACSWRVWYLRSSPRMRRFARRSWARFERSKRRVASGHLVVRVHGWTVMT